MHVEVHEKPGKIAKAFDAAKMSSVGIEMAVCTVIGWGLGHWLDGLFGTRPALTIVLFLCGVAAGFKAMIRAGREARRQASMPAAPAADERPGAPGKDR
jgi:F0F1-type ATP synthase assembly protein I